VTLPGVKIRELRQTQAPATTQRELARQVGLSQARISAIERSRSASVTYSVAERLASVLGTTIEELGPLSTRPTGPASFSTLRAVLERQHSEVMEKLEQIAETQRKILNENTQIRNHLIVGIPYGLPPDPNTPTGWFLGFESDDEPPQQPPTNSPTHLRVLQNQPHTTDSDQLPPA
jgi:transcriptional regulator with XRE-family HTH domain